MNYTDKYHLPQWEKTDRVLMEDFNQMCRDVEAGLDCAVQHGSDAASQAENNAVAAASRAQNTANSAVAKANAAQAAADRAFCPEYLPFQAGTYTGNGGTTVLQLGFRPSFAIITNQGITSDNVVKDTIMVGLNGNVNIFVQFTDTGMNLIDLGSQSYPRVNTYGTIYNYIAFR